MPIILHLPPEIAIIEPAREAKPTIPLVISGVGDTTRLIIRVQTTPTQPEVLDEEFYKLYSQVETLFQKLNGELEASSLIPQIDFDEKTRKEFSELVAQGKITEVIEKLKTTEIFTKLLPQQQTFIIVDFILSAEDNKPADNQEYLLSLKKAMEDVLKSK